LALVRILIKIAAVSPPRSLPKNSQFLRLFHDALERVGNRADGAAGPAPAREFADVARFFRLEALWQLAQVKTR
jgi:hypothetical protein